jgi:hypothetical protein
VSWVSERWSGCWPGRPPTYWYLEYGARLSNPGYDPSYNYAGGPMVLGTALFGALAGAVVAWRFSFAIRMGLATVAAAFGAASSWLRSRDGDERTH